MKKETGNGQLINEKIRFDKMQVISQEGENFGIISRAEALQAARIAGLDLVLLTQSGTDGLPVAKIMDYGKALYAKKKQAADSKKSQKTIQIKEMKFRPKIGDHDFETKLNQAIDFIKDGKHVKVTLMFRGREIGMKEERGTEMFKRIDESFAEAGLTKIFAEKDMRSTQLWSRVYYLKK